VPEDMFTYFSHMTPVVKVPRMLPVIYLDVSHASLALLTHN